MGARPMASETDFSRSLEDGNLWHEPLSEDQKVLHLLNRATFGPRPGDAERVQQMGVEAFLNQQLDPERIDDSAINERLASLSTLSMSSEELVEDFPRRQPAKKLAQRQREQFQKVKEVMEPPAQAKRSHPLEVQELQGPRRVLMELAQEEVMRAISSERQLQEVMVQFWMNHFNIFAPKGADLWFTTSFERDTIRPRTMGKFEDLLVATAKSPAMLFYLDNWMSSTPNPSFIKRRGPMAGFARRGGYRPFGQPFGRFGPAPFGPKGGMRMADNERMRAMRRKSLANRARRGLNENYGRELMELHTLGVNGGYTQKDVIEVARCLTGWTIDKPGEGGGFIFRPQMHDYGSKAVLGHKIKAGRGIEDGYEVLHILAHHPSTAHFISLQLCRRFVADNPPPSVVERASGEFHKSKGDIRAVVKTILTSPEFNSRAAYKSKVKSPIELVSSSVRALGGESDVNLPTLMMIARMGEPMLQYLAPSGYPDRGNTWINSGALLTRMNFARALMANRFPGLTAEPPDFLSGIGNGPPENVVDDISERLLGGPLFPKTREAILNSLPGMAQDARADGDESTSPSKVRMIASLVLASPDFQMK